MRNRLIGRATAARAVVAAMAGLAFVASVSGCARRGPGAAERTSVVALVGDRPVEYAAFAAYVKAAAGDDPKTVAPKVASSLLDQFLDERLVDRAVEEAVPAAAGATPAEKRRDLIARRAGLASLTDEDLRKEYESHPDRSRRPAQLRISQLLFSSKEKADAARRRLQAGEAWADVSREASEAANAADGGPLGLVALDDLPKEFANAVAATPTGAVTPILSAPHGFHLFRVEERLPDRSVPFEDAAPGLRLAVSEERSARALTGILEDARRRWPPAVIEEHLPFPYVGTAARFSLDSRP